MVLTKNTKKYAFILKSNKNTILYALAQYAQFVAKTIESTHL